MSSPLNIFIGELEQLSKTSARPLAVLVGPTASGKTAASMELAQGLTERGITVEIVNAAYAGRAQVRIDLGKYAEAAQDAARIATSYRFQAEYSDNSSREWNWLAN